MLFVFIATCRLGTAAGSSSAQQHSHRWSIYVRGLENEDLSYYIKSVTFHLHASFNDPVRCIEQAPFEIHETGWGEFTVQIVIEFQPDVEEDFKNAKSSTVESVDAKMTDANATNANQEASILSTDALSPKSAAANKATNSSVSATTSPRKARSTTTSPKIRGVASPTASSEATSTAQQPKSAFEPER
jgi:transcription initiation factor IIF auxiliary subunit